MTQRNKQNLLSRIFFNQFAYFIIGFIVIAALSFPVVKNASKQSEISKEIKELENEIKTLEAGNSDLKTLIDYLESDQFTEEQAKLNLNYKKEGEEVVIIKPKEDTDSTLENSRDSLYNNKSSGDRSSLVLANPAKWWRHFFQ